ncbi:MAG: hypothetical protein Fur006_50330 [Coleofasciculaceae cyanobacterium]
MFVTEQRLSIANQAFTEALKRLDLEPIAYKLMHPSEGTGWTYQETQQAIAGYLNFLSLIHLYPNLPLVPTQEIDRVWHHHILDTSKYAQDCQMLFGRFIHHFPYFGLRGESDRQNLHVAFEQTQTLFQEHFGVDEGMTEESVQFADCQPLGYSTDLTRPRVALDLVISC